MLAQVTRSLFIATFIAGLAGMLPGAALSAEAVSVVILDLQKVDALAKSAKSANGQWTSYRRQIQVDTDKARKEADQKARDLQKQKSILDTAAFRKKYQELSSRVTMFNKKLAVAKNSIDRSFQRARGVIRTEAVKITSKIAKEKGADLVLQSGAVLLLFKKSLDITDEVIAELDKVLPTIKLEDPTKLQPKKAKAK